MQGDLLALFTQGDQTSGFRLQPLLSSAFSPILYGTVQPGPFFTSFACLDFDVCESLEFVCYIKGKDLSSALLWPSLSFVLWTYLFLSFV